MSRLSSRPGWSVDASEFITRSHGSHSLQWRAQARRWVEGGGSEVLLDDVPIVGGRLSLDASDPIRRTLTLDVAGGSDLEPKLSTDPLVPFGQFIILYVRIDRADGTWFPWLKMGEYPIRSYSFERPSERATVEAEDYSGRVNEYLHLGKTSYAGMRVSDAIVRMVTEALPAHTGRPSSIWTEANTRKIANYSVEAGVGRWDAAIDLGDRKGIDSLFDWNGDLVIRRAIADADDIVGPSNGPDIGTKGSPVATVTDGTGGNLVAMTATVTREGGCNYVRINLHPTATAKGKGTKGPDYQVARVNSEVSSGPATWGDVFGYLPIVQSRDVHKTTASVISQAREDADAIKHRRRGVVRYIDLDAVGLYWLEPDDKVRIETQDVAEDHFVGAVSFDLSGQNPTRVTTRQLAVEDPGL